MKIILSLLLLFLFILPSVALSGVEGAKEGPNASLRTDPTHRYVFLTFTNLQTVSKISYTLTYITNNVTKGFEGGFRTYGRMRRSVRRQILGTCSSGKCVFHKTPHSFQLTVTLTLKSGGTTTITKSLP